VKQLIEYTRQRFLRETSKVHVALYSGSRGEEGFITLFFFSENGPVLAAKVARTKRSLERLEHEYVSLRQVTRLLQGSPLETTIEAPLDFVEFGGLFILFKEYKDGIPATQYLRRGLSSRRSRGERFLCSSVDWLIGFTKHTQEVHTDSADAKGSAINALFCGQALTDYAKLFVNDSTFFLAPTHGELLPANILLDKGSRRVTSVVDFENFSMAGLPIADLIGLIMGTGVSLFGCNETTLDKRLLQDGWFLNLCCDCIRKFCSAFSIDMEAFKEVMPLYSDRALYLCRKWNMKGQLLEFHQRFRRTLMEKMIKL